MDLVLRIIFRTQFIFWNIGNIIRALSVTFGPVLLLMVVNEVDFDVWYEHRFTESDAWTDGDLNGDGLVDVSDFNIWNDNKSLAMGEIGQVPEPASGLILLLALAAVSCVGRR